MKLAKGMLLAALAAWAVASPSPARATGKIRSVDVYDPEGVHSFPNPQAPLAAGDTFRVRFRLVNLGWAQTVWDASYANPWVFRYTGPLTGDAEADERTMAEAEKPRLGLWIGGQLREADCANWPMGVASDWLAELLDGERHYTDLIFEYRVRPGDLALPVQLANEAGTGPAKSGDRLYLKCNGRETLWKMVDARTHSATNELAFGPSNLYDDPDFAGEDLTKWRHVNTPGLENLDYDLSGAGVHVRGVDFDPAFFDGDAGVWRSIAQGSTAAEPAAPSIRIGNDDGDGALDPLVLYLWTADTNVAEIAVGGAVDDIRNYVFPDGVTRKVGRLRVAQGDRAVPFGVKATGDVGDKTQLFLAPTPTNVLDAEGNLVTNFLARTVRVGEPIVAYPLWVGGVQVCETNKNNILGDGTARFEGTATNGTLFLADATITGTYSFGGSAPPYTAAVYADFDFDLEIALSGSNRVVNTNGTSWGFYPRGNLVIAGDGVLDVEAGTQGIFVSGSLLVRDATVVVDCHSASALGGSGIAISNAVVTAVSEGNGAAIESSGDLVIADSTVVSTGIDRSIQSYAGAIRISGASRVTAETLAENGTALFARKDVVLEGDNRIVAPAGGWIGEHDTGFYAVRAVLDPATDAPATRVVIAPETTSVRIVKVWDDDSDRAGRRPSSVSFTLAGGSFSTNVVLDCSGGADRLETTVSGVPRYEGGSEIAYAVVEDPVPGDYRAVVVDEGKVVPETVVEPGVSLSLTVNGEQNVRIGESDTLTFRATLSGAEPVGSVEWSWDSGSDTHTARTDLSGAGEATLAHTYEELKTLATAGEEYVMTATYRTNGVEAARARVPFGLLGENPAVVFVEPALDGSFGVDEAIAFKVLGYKGRNSEILTLRWQCAGTQLSTGYSAPANNTTEATLAFREAGDHRVTVTVADQDGKSGTGTIVVHVVEPPEPIQSFSVTNSYAPPPAVTLSTPDGLATFSEGSTGPEPGRIDVGLTARPTADITVHLDVRRIGTDTGNYPLPELSSYNLEFGSGSPTNQSVYFEWLDGTPAGATDGYLLTAFVTNATAGPSGVAWKDLYAPGAMTNYVANEAPQIMSFAPTDASPVVAGVPFAISYSVRDVPADFAAGLTLTWTTSEGFATSYQVTATSVSNYVDYAATSPPFTFSSAGPHSVSLVVEDKDRGTSEEAVFDVTVLPPPAPPSVSNVVARQRWPWNGLVDVDYEVGGTTTGLVTRISFAEQGGAGRSWVATNFLAGAEPSAEPGFHRATWDTAADGATDVVAGSVVATVELVRFVPTIPDVIALAQEGTFSLIGSTVGDFSWGQDVDLAYDAAAGCFSVVTTFKPGDFKIRFNHDWSIVMGGEIGAVRFNGGNIISEVDGVYKFILDVNTVPFTIRFEDAAP